MPVSFYNRRTSRALCCTAPGVGRKTTNGKAYSCWPTKIFAGKEELDSVQPNTAILEKLRAEMKKLAQKLSDGGEPPLKRTRRIGDSDEPILNEEEAIRASREYAEKHKNGSMHHVRL